MHGDISDIGNHDIGLLCSIYLILSFFLIANMKVHYVIKTIYYFFFSVILSGPKYTINSF